MTIKLGPDGRVLIPVELRRALDLEPGMALVARVDDDRLVLERRDTVLRRLQELFDVVPPEVSIVDELLAERRREAARDAGG
jgi:bifunctional DNA-binding transcriptional regulator/antitoxin component of YhaV-PrlF toxin-antitoxin module